MKQRPNDRCACGSGKKYKQCCGATSAQANARRDLLSRGVALHQAGQVDAAEAIYRQLLEQNPRDPDAANYQGLICFGRRQYDAAVNWLRQALDISPKHPAYWCNLANALKRLGHFAEARDAYRTATVCDNSLFQAWFNWALLELEQTHAQAAGDLAARAVGLNPGFAEAHYVLGQALFAQGRIDDAYAAYRQTLALKPDYAQAKENLASILVGEGAPESALAMLDEGAPSLSGGVADGIRLMASLYLPQSPQKLLDDHIRAMQGLAEYLPLSVRSARKPGRIRVAYLSPDFRTHAMRYFVRPLLKGHDRDRFDVFAYSIPCLSDDPVTDELRALADHWVDAGAMTDDDVARHLQSNDIDVLVDLAGHSRGGRPGILARQPAPVQITMLGYLGPLGMPQVNYRLSDAVACPPGKETWFNEQVLRARASQWCYVPDLPLPEIPVRPNGPPVFGHFGHPPKITDPVARLWGQLLRQLPEARLRVVVGSELARRTLTERFHRASVPMGQVEYVGRRAPQEYLRMLGEVDACLDTFPYTGGTTGCDALLMGTPVVSLANDSPLGRGGASVLSAAGFEDWVVYDADAYVALAARLGTAGPRTRVERQAVRDQLLRSDLCNVARYVENLEGLFEQAMRQEGVM